MLNSVSFFVGGGAENYRVTQVFGFGETRVGNTICNVACVVVVTVDWNMYTVKPQTEVLASINTNEFNKSWLVCMTRLVSKCGISCS